MASTGYGAVELHQADSIEDRIKLIGQQVDASQKDPYIRAVAFDIVRGGPEPHGSADMDYVEDVELAQIFYFTKNNIEYRDEGRDYDAFSVGRRTMEMRAGDCDDHAILVAGLLSNLGYLTGAKVISPDGQNWHIYPVAGTRSKHNPTLIVPLDTTQKADSYPGWEPPMYQRQHELLATFTGGRTLIRRIQ